MISSKRQDRVKVLRPVKTRSSLGETIRTLTLVGTSLGRMVSPKREWTLLAAGKGLEGTASFFGPPNDDIRLNDILEVIEGFEAGNRFIVSAVRVRHPSHLKATIEPYHSPIPAQQ